MKKLVSFFAVAIVSAAMMFANGELNVRGFGQFVNFSDAKLVGNYESKVDLMNFGLEVEGNLWFVHPWIMDVGLSTAVDLGFGTASNKGTVLGNSVSSSEPDFEFGFTIAPAVQFNLNEKHSIFVAPGIRFPLTITKYEVSFGNTKSSGEKYLFYPEFTLDIGYKFWFTNFLGINAGYELGIPLTLMEGGNKVETASAFSNKFYIGVALNLGKRNAQ